MQYQEFVNRVSERMSSVESTEPEHAIQATLATLGEHLGGARAEELGRRLPAELEAQLARGNYSEVGRGFSAEEFHRRVAELGGSPRAEEDGGVQGQVVLSVLSEALGGLELAEDLGQPLREAAPPAEAGDLPR